jgi:hypothetical protein
MSSHELRCEFVRRTQMPTTNNSTTPEQVRSYAYLQRESTDSPLTNVRMYEHPPIVSQDAGRPFATQMRNPGSNQSQYSESVGVYDIHPKMSHLQTNGKDKSLYCGRRPW